MTSTIGIAGGVLLGRAALQRQRKILGIPLRSKVDIDLSDASQRLGGAARTLGKLVADMRTVRERAERIGHALG